MPFSGEVIDVTNVRELTNESLVGERAAFMDEAVLGSLRQYVVGLVRGMPGDVAFDSAQRLAKTVVGLDEKDPLFSGRAFRYPAVSSQATAGNVAQDSVDSAHQNIRYMVQHYGLPFFASQRRNDRRYRYEQWHAPLDETYELKVRGASGASAFSVDFGLGIIDKDKKHPVYKELWRAGIDTEYSTENGLGARFIRTGSAVKPGEDDKKAAFEDFRKRYHILPQRLLGLVGLYYMRELKPEYAVALNTVGAERISTLGKSHGGCDYTGIFEDLGFQPRRGDKHWLHIPDFADGFYTALDHADIRRSESHGLHLTMEAINNMQPEAGHSALFPPTQLCTDDSRDTIERELAAILPKPISFLTERQLDALRKSE